MEAYLVVLSGAAGRATAPAGQAADAAVYVPAVRSYWPVARALARIRKALEGQPEGGELVSFVPGLPETPDRSLRLRAAIASTLLASLELAKDGAVHFHQPDAWGPVALRLCDAAASGDDTAGQLHRASGQ